MKVFGYCRVSTQRQGLERQERNIKEKFPDAIIVKEKFTGTVMERPKWLSIIQNVKSNDCIVFDSVSRMSRDAEEGFALYETLYNKGVELVFLKEPHINTSVFRNAIEKTVPLTGSSVDLILKGINDYLFELAREQIKIAFEQSQKEVDDLHNRIREGLITAKLKNKRIGLSQGTKLTTKKSFVIKEGILKYSKDFNGTLLDKDCIKIIGCSRNSYYKYKANLDIELQ